MKLPSVFSILLCILTTDSIGVSASVATYFGSGNGSNAEEYTAWLNNSSLPYAQHTFLTAPQNPNNNTGMAVHWTIQGDEIRLAVAARTTGWLGFGIADAGGMKGSDIFLFDSETQQVVDSYVLDENVKPLPDDCQSWKLLDSFVGEEFLIVELSRLLDTKDLQDRAFRSDGEVFQFATRVIGAWGDSATPTFHGTNFAKGSVRFFGSTSTTNLTESFRSAMDLEADGSFSIGARNYSVPALNDTHYGYFCVTYEDLVAKGVLQSTDEKKHIIGVEPVIDPRSSQYVHHFLVYGSTNPGNYSCGDVYDGYTELFFMWGPGGFPAQPPPQVGIALGGQAGYLSFRIEVHYTNPKLLAGIVDSSGVTVYYTSTVRQYDQGVLILGDPYVNLRNQVLSIEGGLAQHSFFCPSNCTQYYFGGEVTVYSEVLHMHKSGKAMRNELIRDGVVIRQGVSQYFDYTQQGGYEVVQAPFQIKPGDAFNVVCSFDADRGATWGLASSEEMCISFLSYYPRQVIGLESDSGPAQIQPLCGVGLNLIGCEVDHLQNPNFTRFELADREFGRSSNVTGGTTCGAAAATNNTDEGSTTMNSGTPSLYFGLFTIFLFVSLQGTLYNY